MSRSQVVIASAKCTPCTGLSNHRLAQHFSWETASLDWLPILSKIAKWKVKHERETAQQHQQHQRGWFIGFGQVGPFFHQIWPSKRNQLLGTSFDLALVIHLSPHSRPNAICTHQKVSFLCWNHVGVRNLSENDVDMKLELDGVCVSHPRTLNRLRKTSGNVWNPCLHSILLIHWTSALQTYHFSILFSYVWRICILTSIG